MLRSRVILVILALALALMLVSSAKAEEPLGPGDKGYLHGLFHPDYQKVFKNCKCTSGECRPTNIKIEPITPEEAARNNPNDPYVKDLKIKVSGVWCRFRQSTVVNSQNVPKKLFSQPAHVCAGIMPTQDPPPEDPDPCDAINIECTWYHFDG